jgi:hypothetical protein
MEPLKIAFKAETVAGICLHDPEKKRDEQKYKSRFEK